MSVVELFVTVLPKEIQIVILDRIIAEALAVYGCASDLQTEVLAILNLIRVRQTLQEIAYQLYEKIYNDFYDNFDSNEVIKLQDLATTIETSLDPIDRIVEDRYFRHHYY